MDHRIAARRQRVREAGARRRLRWTLFLVIGALVVGAAAWLAQSPFLAVNEVTIAGVDRSEAVEILGRAGVQHGEPMVAIRAGRVEDSLLADPWIAEADVRLVWPDMVEVAVREHQPAGWVRGADDWLLMSAEGAVLASAPQPGDDQPAADLAPVAAVPGDVVVEPAVLGALAFFEALPAGLAADIVVRGDVRELWATVPGHVVRLGGPVEMAEKALTLAALVGDSGIESGSGIDLLSPRRPAVLPPVSPIEGSDPEAEPDGAATNSDDGAESP